MVCLYTLTSANTMITCNVKGGLGNQLFQICATIAYAMRKKMPFMFSYKQEIAGETPRPMYWNTLLRCLKNYTNYHGLITDATLESFTEYRGEHGYKEIPGFEYPHVRLDGFFQSYKYFQAEYSRIYELLDIDTLKSELTITDSSREVPTISLHFRIGDYINKRCYHPVLPLIYYQRALQHIIERAPAAKHARVIVFYEERDRQLVNDSITQLQRVFTTLSFEFVDEPSDWKQMLYMSKCTHHIIANSTFSWWGATFASSDIGGNITPDKIVCYPSIWYGHQLYYITTADLFPPNWSKIAFYPAEMDMSYCKCFGR
jgi:hypothetical protein